MMSQFGLVETFVLFYWHKSSGQDGLFPHAFEKVTNDFPAQEGDEWA